MGGDVSEKWKDADIGQVLSFVNELRISESEADVAEDAMEQSRQLEALLGLLTAPPSSDEDEAAVVQRLRDAAQALPGVVGALLDASARHWRVHSRSREDVSERENASGNEDALSADLRAQELSAELRVLEQRLQETESDYAEAEARESEREMRLCRIMHQEARETAELRQSLQAENQAEERKAASVKVAKCEQDLAKARRRNTELLKDLQLLISQSRAERKDVKQEAPPPEEFSFAKGLSAFFGGGGQAGYPTGAKTTAEEPSLLSFASMAPPSDATKGGASPDKASATVKPSPRQEGPGSSRGTGKPRGNKTPRDSGKSPRGTGAGTPRQNGNNGKTAMPGSMRELAQILAPQTLVTVDPAEARIHQLQKLVRELTVDLQERDDRIAELSRELGRSRMQSGGGLEALGEDDEDRFFRDGGGEDSPGAGPIIGAAPLSARGSRAEGGPKAPAIPQMKRLSLPLREFSIADEDSPPAMKGGIRSGAQSAR